MSVAMLERAARELQPFLDEIAFVGGATIELWITDPAAPPPRVTKGVELEAWNGRGNGDHLRSHDLEDLIGLVDGRAEILEEVGDAPSELRSFIAEEIRQLLDEQRFTDPVDGSVAGPGRRGSTGSGGENRVDEIVMPRLRVLAES